MRLFFLPFALHAEPFDRLIAREA